MSSTWMTANDGREGTASSPLTTKAATLSRSRERERLLAHSSSCSSRAAALLPVAALRSPEPSLGLARATGGGHRWARSWQAGNF